MHSPDGSRGGKFETIGSAYGVEGCKIVFLGALPVQLFRHFRCRMYRLATMHSVTDRRTDRPTVEECGAEFWTFRSRSGVFWWMLRQKVVQSPKWVLLKSGAWPWPWNMRSIAPPIQFLILALHKFIYLLTYLLTYFWVSGIISDQKRNRSIAKPVKTDPTLLLDLPTLPLIIITTILLLLSL